MRGAVVWRAAGRLTGVCVLSWGCHAGALAAESGAGAAALKRDSAHCLAHAGMDACDDAVRRSPNDPQLLVALGDEEARNARYASALKHYQRAAQLAPGTRGLSAKISATDARLHPKKPAVVMAKREPKVMPSAPKPPNAPRASVVARAAPATATDEPADVAVPEKHYTNEAPAAESH